MHGMRPSETISLMAFLNAFSLESTFWEGVVGGRARRDPLSKDARHFWEIGCDLE